MNAELDQASHYLDEALIAFSARQTDEAHICIHEAAMILENLSAALQTVEEAPHAQAATLRIGQALWRPLLHRHI